jgi:serine/threonine protein kinase
MPCPSDEQLRNLLADRLAGPEAEAIESHIEACAPCQRALESMTSTDGIGEDKPSWLPSDGSSLLSDAAAATWQGESGGDFLRRLENTPPPAAYSVPSTPEAGSASTLTPPGNGGHAREWPVVAGYQILRELGRGGMGVVYLAWQTKLNRHVALKMILAGAHAGQEQLERFRVEAESVARLQHPNIVQIHEVGEQDGRPYFSLEYVDGISLPQKLVGTPQPPREAAEVIHTLALAVHYAHQRGVVHRDLKPANILLQGNLYSESRQRDKETRRQGESAADSVSLPGSTPKITDFGLAKRLDMDSGQTRSGDIIGTPSYMAPEQAAGKTQIIGPVVDVYALGAILYEMLTGRPPFRAETPVETLRQVVGEEPVRPTRLQPKVPRDLETICLQCLQKQPERRYATAAALADDLQRFLRGEPISARPTPWWEVAAKWAKRRPALAGLVAVSILAALSLAVGGLWYNAHLQAALLDAREQRDKAADRFQMAREAVDQFHTKVSESPELKAKGTERLRTQLLETALRFYQRFVQEEGGAEVQAERGRAYYRLAALYGETGRNKEAEDAYQHALQIFRSLAAANPDVPEFQLNLADGYNELHRVYLISARTQEAETALEQALELTKRLAENHPADQKYQRTVGVCYRNLSNLYTQTGRPQLAERAIKEAQTVLERLSGDAPDVQELLAQTYHALGVLYHTTNRRNLAEEPYARALALRKSLVKTRPDCQPDLLRSYRALGTLYIETERYPEAEKIHKEALAICKELAASHPTMPDYQKLLAGTYEELGNVYLETGPYDRAETNYRQALDIQRSLASANPDVLDNTAELGFTCANLGMLMTKVGKRETALKWFDEALEALESVLKKEPRHTDAQHGLGLAYSQRAVIASDLGRYQEVVSNLDRALQLDSEEDKLSLRVRRARALAYLHEYARAVAEANQVAKGGFAGGNAFYDLACLYSVASAAAREDTRMPASERDRLAGEYTRQAIEYLRKAKEAGLFKDQKWIEAVKKDTDFDPIRTGAGFKDVLTELQRQSKTPASSITKPPER